jgi:hypothetical protein
MSYYILTLPAFEWIQVDFPNEPWRVEHVCISDGKAQMIIAGGLDPTVPGGMINQNETVDPRPWGFGTFNMSALDYNERYDPSGDAYRASSKVENIYRFNKYDRPQWPEDDPEKANSFEVLMLGNLIILFPKLKPYCKHRISMIHRRPNRRRRTRPQRRIPPTAFTAAPQKRMAPSVHRR